MVSELISLKQTLIRRLERRGIQRSTIPGFIRSLAQSFFVNPGMNLLQVNQRLQYLGWQGFELDYHTLQLVIACFEIQDFEHLDNIPAHWFEADFTRHKSHVKGYLISTKTLLA